MTTTALSRADPTAPFHEGEKALQAYTGSRAKLEEVGSRVIRPAMPEQHRSFFAQLPFMVIGLVDAQGQPWASVLAAPPGFVQSPDDRHLDIAALPLPNDPAAAALTAGASIGLLGIEPHTRRRNRVNGMVGRVGPDGFSVNVRQSFGNCPKYIRTREAVFVAPRGRAAEAERGDRLDENAMRFIAQADTFFIATAHSAAQSGDGASAHGVDVSHRGGPRGFVQVVDDRTLVAPDYLGNFFFNTLGNLLVNPRAGLLFIDYETGDLLHVAVTVGIVQDGPEVAAHEGAQRLLWMQVAQMQRLPSGLPLRWSEPVSLPLGR
ncbi:pyridoxamine 5'-phosphate oxidase family protein [Variovorax humicola]|uniref:Pyridoxamine 5'-phosphate oxidase family protein n=1 Tax=Variovorax humicola TaxID=1769758 RepID=A0ABU8W2D2_9BURK